MEYEQLSMYPPQTCALAITARRDQWGEWTVTATVGREHVAGVDWMPSETYTELTRQEAGDVIAAVATTFGN